MAINLDAVRKRLQSLQNTTTKQSNLWKPEPGEQLIRIVPYQYDKDNPFIELYFHYGLGGKNYLSPVTHGNADPVVEFAEKLKATGNSDDWKLARKLEPKMRTYVPIVVRGKEHEGVKFWGFGKTVYQELLGIIADPDYGDISDPVQGRDIKVTFKTAEELGKNFPETTIMVKPNQTAVSDDSNVIEKITNQQEITEIFKEPSYEDLTTALENYLSPEDSTEETTTTTTSETEQSTEMPVEKVSDVGSAFDKLFNNQEESK